MFAFWVLDILTLELKKFLLGTFLMFWYQIFSMQTCLLWNIYISIWNFNTVKSRFYVLQCYVKSRIYIEKMTEFQNLLNKESRFYISMLLTKNMLKSRFQCILYNNQIKCKLKDLSIFVLSLNVENKKAF